MNKRTKFTLEDVYRKKECIYKNINTYIQITSKDVIHIYVYVCVHIYILLKIISTL